MNSADIEQLKEIGKRIIVVHSDKHVKEPKRNCHTCYGRGVITRTFPARGQIRTPCHCVK